MFDELIQASPLPSKRSSVYLRGEPSWECTPQVGVEDGTSVRKGENLDQVLDSIEAPRFLDFAEMIKEEGGNCEEEVEFGKIKS
jgi:hypothetical protein